MISNDIFASDNWNEVCNRGIVNLGNLFRIYKVVSKAQGRESIKVGFIGGSITAGSLSSTPQTCYAYLVYRWWKEKFPMSDMEYINAGIGATTSQLGVARVDKDLLNYEPDVVFVEFSVNDQDEEKYSETYEGLIRRILSSPSNPAVIIINNVVYDNGWNAQKIHNQIGRYYELPIVSIKDSIYKEVEKENLKAESITPDFLHPNDLGHKLVADVITNLLDDIYKVVVDSQYVENSYIIPKKTITKNSYYKSVLRNSENALGTLEGFKVDEAKKEGLWDIFKLGWYGSEIGSKLTFSLDCSNISVLYRKYAKKVGSDDNPAPIARLVVDGKEGEAITLDSSFDEDWGDCLYVHDVLKDECAGSHLVEITITKQVEGRAFYIASIITA